MTGPYFAQRKSWNTSPNENNKATFFVIGRNLVNPKLRELAIKALQQGHDIGNHSYDHPNFSSISAKRAEREIVSTHELIQAIVRESGRESETARPVFSDFLTVLQDRDPTGSTARTFWLI